MMRIDDTAIGCSGRMPREQRPVRTDEVRPGQDGGVAAETSAAAEISADDPANRASVVLLPGRHRRAEGGHPWIYSNEVRIDVATKALSPGALVTLRRAGGSALGVGMFNPHSLLAARLLDRDCGRAIGRRFLTGRIERALRLRQRIFTAPYHRPGHADAGGRPRHVG